MLRERRAVAAVGWIVLGAALAACRGGARDGGRPPARLVDPPALAMVADAGVADAFVEPPLALSIVDSCDAPAIPSDPKVRSADGGAAPERVRLEVPYGPDVKQTLDITWPATPGPHPLVVLLHGGGWTAGDKHLFWPTMRALSERGWVAATINYRLARDDARAFPVGMNDARCGTAWLVSHARELQADPARLVVLGASAGGHMAALLGLAPDAPAFTSDCASSRVPHLAIAGVIAYYAPLELRDAASRYPPKMLEAVEELLRTDAGTPEWNVRGTAATPRTYLGVGSAPPILLLHGDADKVVPIDDSRTFQRALDAHGVPSLLVELHDQGHGFAVLGRKEPILRATCTAWAFLDRVAARR